MQKISDFSNRSFFAKKNQSLIFKMSKCPTLGIIQIRKQPYGCFTNDDTGTTLSLHPKLKKRAIALLLFQKEQQSENE